MSHALFFIDRWCHDLVCFILFLMSQDLFFIETSDKSWLVLLLFCTWWVMTWRWWVLMLCYRQVMSHDLFVIVLCLMSHDLKVMGHDLFFIKKKQWVMTWFVKVLFLMSHDLWVMSHDLWFVIGFESWLVLS